MADIDSTDLVAVLQRIRSQAAADEFRVTQHAASEMMEENFRLDDVVAALLRCQILENYPQHRRGACCLVYGDDDSGRPVHIVCTTTTPTLIIITVYEPKAPKWISPTQRRAQP